VMATTKVDLDERVRTGAFRRELLYRLRILPLELTPLRERRDDIPLIASHYAQLFARKYNKPELRLDAGALERLQQYAWPGNVRELRHAIERLVIMSEQGVPQLDSLPPGAAASASAAVELDTLNLEALEKQAIQKAIAQHHGNLSKAAQSLGLGRTTLYRKMTRHGIQ